MKRQSAALSEKSKMRALQAGIFQLPGKKQLLDPEAEALLVVIDATETPIERPKKGQKRFYSGKKKRHTPEAEQS